MMRWITMAAVTACAALSAAADDEKVERFKTMALEKAPASAATLRTGLVDADPIVRRLAIYGLQRIGDPAASAAITPLLDDGDPWVGRTAATALGKLGNRAAAAALVEALDADDVNLRLDAFVALGRLGDPASQKPILAAMRDMRLWTELDVWNQMALLHVLEREWFVDPGAVDVLRWLLDYGRWEHPEFAELEESRRAAYRLLIANRAADILAAKYGDDAGLPHLLAGLEADDHMRQRSARALAAIKPAAAVEPLGAMLADRWLMNKGYALRALGAIGGERAAALIEPFLTHKDIRLRRTAAAAYEKAAGPPKTPADLTEPAEATVPAIADLAGRTPGGERPPQFIVLGVDDCVNAEGLEAILDIVETLRTRGRTVVFTLFVSPLSADADSRDMLKQTLLLQRLFDLGCEIANHTLHHNPGGRRWVSLPRERQVEEVEGATRWFQENIDGFTSPFSFKGPGGGKGEKIDPAFTKTLLDRQGFIYRGKRVGHPAEQTWPAAGRAFTMIPTGVLDADAPPVHALITDGIPSDYPGRFDYEIDDGVAMWMANFDYHYRHPLRPILAVNAFHDWGFKSLDDSTCQWTHRNEAAILKQFLLEALVTQRDRYPDTHCVTFRQVLEYVRTDGDLERTLALGNGQDSRHAAAEAAR